MNRALDDHSLLYLQIAQMLEDNILNGVYREDEQAPSTNELAQRFQVNPATAAKGLNVLTREGILYKRRGVGMFVAPEASEKIREKRRSAFYEDFVKPLVREGTSLSLMGRDLLEMLRHAIEEEQEETKK